MKTFRRIIHSLTFLLYSVVQIVRFTVFFYVGSTNSEKNYQQVRPQIFAGSPSYKIIIVERAPIAVITLTNHFSPTSSWFRGLIIYHLVETICRCIEPYTNAFPNIFPSARFLRPDEEVSSTTCAHDIIIISVMLDRLYTICVIL